MTEFYPATDTERKFAEYYATISPTAEEYHRARMRDIEEATSRAITLLAGSQRALVQSSADDMASIRLQAEAAPKAQRASDIARDAAVLFADRTDKAIKGDPADTQMAECVRLAKLARTLAEE